MNVLICNVGSTSLKYQLFRMPEELVAASGGAERVGTDAGRFYAKTQENGALVDEAAVFPTHREAIERMLLQLQQTVLPDLRALDCVGFKVVLARGVSGVQLLTDDVLARMEDFSSIAPAHNPPYLAAIRQFRALLPNTPLIGAFETAFHRTMPPEAYCYSIPIDVSRKYDIRRNIELIRTLYPEVENLAFISDNTYGGISLQALVREEMENYPDLNLVLVDSRDGDEASHAAYASLSPRSAVMLGTWRVGSDGEYLMQRSLNDLVQLNPRLPVFSITRTGIGDVAVGGFVPNYENGANVIAAQIKEYYKTGSLGGVHFHLSDGEYVFDSRKLKELKIAEYALPKGSVIEDTVAAKLSKYSHYIELLVGGIVLLVLLLIFVAFLFLRTRRLKRTLEEREGQLVIAREKAEESDMLKSAFLANMSHEIRTPLNAIVGFSSLMQGEELSQEERAEYCAIVVNNSEMLLTLLNDILDISSLECGKIRFNYSAEEIVQICQHILMTTAHTCQPGVEGRLECAVDSYMLTTDVHRLSQILINLLTNAAKFTSEGSIVLGVEICPEQNEVLFSVTDTGPGIPLDKQEMIFNRFEKLDGNKKKGTGLGLAICRQIAMIFGGRIWVDPTYTGGARFIFAHPIGLRLPEDREHREGGEPSGDVKDPPCSR